MKVSRSKIKKALKESISHWERMINWAKTQPAAEVTSPQSMKTNIQENWQGAYCSLCNLGSIDDKWICIDCPLEVIGEECIKEGSLWINVASAETWGEWVIAANEMLLILKELLKRW